MIRLVLIGLLLASMIMVGCTTAPAESGVSADQFATMSAQLAAVDAELADVSETLAALETQVAVEPSPTMTPTATETPVSAESVEPDVLATIEADQAAVAENRAQVDAIAVALDALATQVATAPTATPTPEPTPTEAPVSADAPSVATSAPATGSDQSALDTLLQTRQFIRDYGWSLDQGMSRGYVRCNQLIALYEGLRNVPQIASEADPLVQQAVAAQESAITLFLNEAFGSYDACVNHIQTTSPEVEIALTDRLTGERYVFPAAQVYEIDAGNLSFDLARIAVSEADVILSPVIDALGGG